MKKLKPTQQENNVKEAELISSSADTTTQDNNTKDSNRVPYLYQIFQGYSSWNIGQLQKELDVGYWITVSTDNLSELIFQQQFLQQKLESLSTTNSNDNNTNTNNTNNTTTNTQSDSTTTTRLNNSILVGDTRLITPPITGENFYNGILNRLGGDIAEIAKQDIDELVYIVLAENEKNV